MDNLRGTSSSSSEMGGDVQPSRQFGRRECDVRVVKKSEKLLIAVGIFIAIALVALHITWGIYKLLPESTWIEYHGVVPLVDEFDVNSRLKFVAHTSLKRPVEIEFTDVLYCRDPFAGDYERWYVNTNRRIHHDIADDKYNTFVFTPGVPYETECYLDTHVVLYLPLNVQKYIHYNGLEHGHTFLIRRDEQKMTEECIENFMNIAPAAQ